MYYNMKASGARIRELRLAKKLDQIELAELLNVVKLDLPELRKLVSLLRYSSNNLNQLARRVHETGRVYTADMDDILQNQERIWQAARGILSRLAVIR